MRRQRDREGDDHDRYYAAISEALHYMMNARWSESAAAMDRVDRAAEDMGHDRLRWVGLSTRGFTHLYEGRFHDVIELVRPQVERARLLGSARDEFSAQVLEVLVHAEAGDWATAEHQVDELAQIFPDAGLEAPSDVRIWCSNLAAVLGALRGAHTDTARLVSESLDAVGVTPKLELTYILQFTRAGVALADGLASGLQGAAREEALHTLGRVSDLLGTLAKAFPLAETASLLVRGRWLIEKGRPRPGRRALTRAHSLAVKRGLAFDQALAAAALSKLPESPEPQRVALAAEARELLSAIGARGRLQQIQPEGDAP